MKLYKVNTDKELREFVMFPYKLYKGDPYWVPPLLMDAKKIASGNTPLFKKGPYRHCIVKDGEEVLGRITCGIDERMNELKGTKEVYFTLFETVNDKKVVELLFEEVEKFAKEMGMKSIKGPISPTNGDDFRGVLIENFNSPPTLLEAYNLPYYKILIRENFIVIFFSCFIKFFRCIIFSIE